jgi:hypothetical protein
MRKSWIVASSCALSLALVAAMTLAQDEKKTTDSKPTKTDEVKGRLPNYFGQIGLSKKQEEDVRKAAQPFDEKIVALKKQIADLEKQIDEQEAKKLGECEKVLNESQKTALKGRREAAEAEKTSKKKKTANGDTKKPEEKKP